MAHTYLTVDFYNNTASCRINGNDYVFSSAEAFKFSTGFPYAEDVRIFAYEPARNIFVVEYDNGQSASGTDLHTMAWVAANLTNIEYAAIQDGIDNPANPPMTLQMERNIRLTMTDWVLIRRQEEDLMGIPRTMSEDKFAQVLAYRQALRDITKTYSGITSVVWPTNPLD